MSGETVPYHLRQNKHVDRQLFIDLLSHANRVTPVKEALYISFGGVYFEDFKLIHQVFGTRRLLSVEREDWVFERQRHNKPYGCIECKRLSSRDLVNGIDAIRRRFGNRQMICWLDFAEAAARRGQLEDLGILTKAANEFDIVRVTMNVNPSSLSPQVPGETAQVRDERRLGSLRDKLADMIPREIELVDVTQNGFSLFGLELIKTQIQRSLSSSPGLFFQPMASYSYSDSEHTMLTVTGIFLREEHRADFIKRTGLGDFEFSGLNWQLIHINVPLLSQREKLTLDQKFGNKKTLGQVASSLKFRVSKNPEASEAMLNSYFKFHRYYPHFHRIQY